MAAPTMLQQLDAQLDQLVSGWNIYTTILCVGIVAYFIYPLVFSTEPDLHPFLLARQSVASRVRQPGESATFRSLETPHGYPLRTGLNVKDPGSPKWTSGRDGDLRDVWKRAASGPTDRDKNVTGGPSKVLTILGKEEIVEHSFQRLSSEINGVGKHLREHGGKRVAIYLSNSTGLLVSIFAAIHHGLVPILVPQDQPLEKLASILNETEADALIVGAGAVPLKDLLKQYSSLKQVIWVVARTSRHMDWNEVPEGEGGRADIAVWHDIVDEKGSNVEDMAQDGLGSALPNLIMLSENGTEGSYGYEVVEYTQKNMVAAISAQINVLPRTHRLTPSDLILPLAPLTEMFSLTVTLAALFSNASIALTSVSGPLANYTSAFHGVSPTIIIAHPQSLSKFCQKREDLLKSGSFAKMRHARKIRMLEAGSMPKGAPSAQEPRLIYTYQTTGAGTASLSSADMTNLRIFTGARLIYALSAAHVAGAISQTNMLDYQSHGLSPRDPSHVGPPLSCLECKLHATGGREIDDDKPVGELIVSGPAVVDDEVVVGAGVMATMTDSNTIAYPTTM